MSVFRIEQKCLLLGVALLGVSGLSLEGRPSAKLLMAGCAEGLEVHKEGLRKSGFNIPADGKHLGISHDKTEGGSSDKEFEYLMTIAPNSSPDTIICQTGFNYGTSAFAFLCSGQARLFSWDLGDHDYVQKSGELIQENFPKRHTLILGDSTQTLKEAASKAPHPDLLKKCDIVFVDGGHNFGIAKADIYNFKELAKPGALLLVDDCGQREKTGSRQQHRVTRAFDLAVTENLVTEEKLEFKENKRSICVGRYAK